MNASFREWFSVRTTRGSVEKSTATCSVCFYGNSQVSLSPVSSTSKSRTRFSKSAFTCLAFVPPAALFTTYPVLYFILVTLFYLLAQCCFFFFTRLPCSPSAAPSGSSGVNESRQVLQEQPDFAQSLLREPNTPVIRKSRGTSTQVSP